MGLGGLKKKTNYRIISFACGHLLDVEASDVWAVDRQRNQCFVCQLVAVSAMVCGCIRTNTRIVLRAATYSMSRLMRLGKWVANATNEASVSFEQPLPRQRHVSYYEEASADWLCQYFIEGLPCIICAYIMRKEVSCPQRSATSFRSTSVMLVLNVADRAFGKLRHHASIDPDTTIVESSQGTLATACFKRMFACLRFVTLLIPTNLSISTLGLM